MDVWECLDHCVRAEPEFAERVAAMKAAHKRGDKDAEPNALEALGRIWATLG